jgi:hypothetical protein
MIPPAYEQGIEATLEFMTKFLAEFWHDSMSFVKTHLLNNVSALIRGEPVRISRRGWFESFRIAARRRIVGWLQILWLVPPEAWKQQLRLRLESVD